MAIAPPRVFTISGSTCQASRQASDCTANASLSSTAPTSAQPIPAAARARSAASTGRDAEPLRLERGDATTGDAGERVDTERRVLGRDEQGRRAVVERGGVAGGDRAVGPEGGLQPGQGRQVGIGADALVAGRARRPAATRSS